jgi:membrane-bound transcription factor site-1 protease
MGDHPYTNYREIYNYLLAMDYYVEILRTPWTCFNASNYQSVLIVDSEEELGVVEVQKMVTDIRSKGLSLILIADWYDELIILDEKYIDDNTRSTWYPITGGANIPSMNNLLKNFGGQFGVQSYEGKFQVGNNDIQFLSGNTIAQWPRGGYLLNSKSGNLFPSRKVNLRAQYAPIQALAGFLDTANPTPHPSLSSKELPSRYIYIHV